MTQEEPAPRKPSAKRNAAKRRRKSTTPTLEDVFLAVQICAATMLESASYIRNELGSVQLSASLRKHVSQLCVDLTSTEARLSSELLPLEPSVAGGSRERGEQVTGVESVMELLRDQLTRMHEVVQALQSASERKPAYGQAYILVAESATNILGEFSHLHEMAEGFTAGSSEGTAPWSANNAVPDDRPRVAAHKFACAVCGAPATVVALLGSSKAGTIVRSSFTGQLAYPLLKQAFVRMRKIVEAGDIAALYACDVELATSYCPDCQLSYCRQHWKRNDVFDDDGWHDSIRGCCPEGHERMLED